MHYRIVSEKQTNIWDIFTANCVTIAKQILMASNVSMSECVEQLPLSTLETSAYLCWMKWFLKQICNTLCVAGGLKGRAESVIRGLKVDFLESSGTSAIGLTGLLLMNKYKGLNVPRGKTPDPLQGHNNKVLFSPTLTLPYAGTFALPSAPWKHGVLSLPTPVTVFSLPAPSEMTWGVLTYSQSFWDRCCFLPDL